MVHTHAIAQPRAGDAQVRIGGTFNHFARFRQLGQQLGNCCIFLHRLHFLGPPGLGRCHDFVIGGNLDAFAFLHGDDIRKGAGLEVLLERSGYFLQGHARD